MKKLGPELEREIRRLDAKGHTLREIARAVKRSRHAVVNVLRREPTSCPAAWNPSAARLSLAQREEIRAGIERGDPHDPPVGLFGVGIEIHDAFEHVALRLGGRRWLLRARPAAGRRRRQ